MLLNKPRARATGVGTVLEKVLSLIVMQRLGSFLTATSELPPLSSASRPCRHSRCARLFAQRCVRGAPSPATMRFISIERAYDSVQHAKLWARCIKMSIGGRFLSSLYAMHTSNMAVLDVNGDLLCKRNPLSSIMFNIYIDALVRRIDDDFATKRGNDSGVLLPYVGDEPVWAAAPAAHLSCDALFSLFFADDGVLTARDRATHQLMLDAKVAELGEICLLLTAKKTMTLVAPPLTATEAQCHVIKRDVSAAGGFAARSEPVRIADEFSVSRCDAVAALESEAGVRVCTGTSEACLVSLAQEWLSASGYRDG